MNVVACGIVVILEVALGCGMFICCYSERRFKNMFARVAEWMGFLVICGLYIWNDTLGFISNLAVFIVGILGCLHVFCLYRCKFSVSFIWMQFYFIMMSLLRTPYVAGRGILLKYDVYHANYGAKPWSGFLYELLLLTLVAAFYYWFWRKHNVSIRKALEKYRIVFLCLAVVAWELMSYVLTSGMDRFSQSVFYVLLWGSGGLFLVIAFVALYWMFQNERNEKRTLSFQQARLAEKQLQQKELYEEHERRMHDMKHVLLFLRQCIEEREYGKALEKIDAYQDAIQGKRVWTGNVNVDFVINSKWMKMEEERIDFQLKVDFFEIPIDELDFSIILGTLLDNAIEAATQCEEENRKIKLLIRMVNEMFGMTLWNTSSGEPLMKRGKFQTTKKDKYIHGWGLESVKGLVEKYGGEIGFHYDARSFEVKIIFIGGFEK